MSSSRPKTPLHPLFLVLPQVRARVAELDGIVAPLESAIALGRLAGVDLYYRTSTEMALLALRFDARTITAALTDRLAVCAAQCGAALLDAGRLPEGARLRFFHTYLPLYDVSLGGLSSPEHAVRALARHLAGAEPIPSAPAAAGANAGRIEVRFRRGDGWQLARLRSMTHEGISIATSTPPHRGDLVDLELSALGIVLVTRSRVVGVASGEAAAALGATGFGARLLPASEEQRAQVDQLLEVMGGERIRALTPPPRRRAARYPVSWPVFLRTPQHKASLRALDVSRHGMFVAADGALAPTEGSVHVTFPVDDRGRPILATARVARSVPARDAYERGLSAGVGLELISLSTQDDQRFAQFVGRIARRAERAVVVAAAPSRLDELVGALAGAGYCTSGVSDAPSLVARASVSGRTPDLVVLDASLAESAPDELQEARKALAVRMVPTITIDGDSPGAAREWVDGALLA